MLLIRQVLTLRRLHASEVLEPNALLLRESQRRRRGLTVGADGRGHGWTGDGLVQVFLTLRYARQAHREAPRSAERFDRRAGRDPQLAETRRHPVRQLPVQAGQPGRRQFFDADFDQEFSVHLSHAHGAPPPCALVSRLRLRLAAGYLRQPAFSRDFEGQTADRRLPCRLRPRLPTRDRRLPCRLRPPTPDSRPSTAPPTATADYRPSTVDWVSTHAFAIATASCRTRRMNAMRSVTPMPPLESSRLNMCEHFRQ